MSARVLVLTLALALSAVPRAAPPQDQAMSLAVASFEDAWQTINETFYDPTFGGVDWAGVRAELLPRARAARSVEEVRGVIREMIDRLGHSHFELLSDSTALPGAGVLAIDIRVMASEVVITRVPRDGSAAAAGLRAGQVLLAIDDATAEMWRRARAGRSSRAQDQRQWEAAYRALYGDDESTAAVKVRDPDGRERTIRVRRDAGAGDLLAFGNVTLRNARLNTAKLSTRSGQPVGLIGFTMWMGAISEPFAEAVDTFRGLDGIILDLRGNPGGVMGMIVRFSGHFMSEHTALGTMRTRSTPELTFKANPQLATTDGRRVAPFAGPLAILVDEQTASTSEIFAGAMQSAGRARVFGRRTMGQALPASTKTLPNGDVLLHVVGDFVTPDGRSLEGRGVVPDEIVPLSIASLASGRDADVDAALSWIDRAGSLLLCSGDLQGTQFLPRWVAPLMRP
jgi:carboxyl-terminal processing protease